MQDRIFAELIRHRWELYGFIRALLHNGQDAEDVFQNVATAIVTQASKGDQITDFRVWARQIARNQVLKLLRDRRSKRLSAVPVEEMVEALSVAWAADPTSPGEMLEEHEALRGCLHQLPAETAGLVRLRFLSSLSYPEIAKRLHKTEVAVRRAVARARLALTLCVRRKLGLLEGEA